MSTPPSRAALSTDRGLRAGLLAFVLVGASCYVGSSFRRGTEGDSCTRTDDCREPLRCVDQVCVDPRTGPSTSSPTTTHTGNTGGGGAAGQGGSAATGDTAGSGGAGATGGT
ncbi:MAG: hypothetical protein JRI23_15635, partial [Deltaproteobacteria bacterium]|nr:hypothetical protein [Deltaproteobacteria bacterium]MBW2533192.1 hypothetical protein [Deltaproteobacteria bacterium]